MYNGLGPSYTDQELLEATKAAWLAVTEEERESISVGELRRLGAVYRSVEFE